MKVCVCLHANDTTTFLKNILPVSLDIDGEPIDDEDIDGVPLEDADDIDGIPVEE